MTARLSLLADVQNIRIDVSNSVFLRQIRQDGLHGKDLIGIVGRRINDGHGVVGGLSPASDSVGEKVFPEIRTQIVMAVTHLKFRVQVLVATDRGRHRRR
jgi:hypothetical protein